MARQLERNVPLKIPEDPKPPVWEIFLRRHRKYRQSAMLVEHRYAMLCYAGQLTIMLVEGLMERTTRFR